MKRTGVVLIALFAITCPASLRAQGPIPSQSDIPQQETIERLMNRGNTFSHARDYARAEEEYRKAVEAAEQTGVESGELILPLHALAVTYANEHRNAEAEATFRRLLAVQEKTLGADDPAVARTMLAVAFACELSGKPGEALGFFEQALSIF